VRRIFAERPQVSTKLGLTTTVRLFRIQLFDGFRLDGTNIHFGGYRHRKSTPKTYPIDAFLALKFSREQLKEGIITLQDLCLLFDLARGADQPQHILNIRNAEIRSLALGQYGVDTFFKRTHSKLIHLDGKQELRRIDWKAGGEPLTVVKVIDSTTRKEYLLNVPPTMKTVKEAVAWTFGLTPEEYKPQKET
jgi:hypothetical protein